MDLLDRLERRLGWIAVPGLVRVIVLFNAVVYVLGFLNPGYVDALTLSPDRVLDGQIWRLVSYIFIPPDVHPLLIVFALWFLWMLGEGLEQAWGSFRLTVFYLVGMLGTTAAAFVTGGDTTNVYLNLSLLFAFATFFPEHTILFMLILPLKIKWVALLSLFLTVGAFVAGGLPAKLAIVAALANYLLFFGPAFLRSLRDKQATAARRERFQSKQRPEGEPLHTCQSCGATEITHPEREFRVTADGDDLCSACLDQRPGPGDPTRSA